MKFLYIGLFIFMAIAVNVASAQQQTGSTAGGFDTTGSAAGTSDTTGSQAGTNIGKSVVLENPLDSSISSIPAFFQAIIDILLVFAIPFVVFFIIYAGFLYVTARGNVETISKAHRALLYALIGGLLILGANVILDIITGTVSEITG